MYSLRQYLEMINNKLDTFDSNLLNVHKKLNELLACTNPTQHDLFIDNFFRNQAAVNNAKEKMFEEFTPVEEIGQERIDRLIAAHRQTFDYLDDDINKFTKQHRKESTKSGGAE